MTARLGADWLFRIRLALAAGLLMLILAPEAAHAHAAQPAGHSAEALHPETGAPEPHAEDAGPGHCHAGLDCSVFAVFAAHADPAGPPLQAKPMRRRQHRSACGWGSCSDPPPPRAFV